MKLDVTPIEYKMKENWLRYFERMQCRLMSVSIKKSDRILFKGQMSTMSGLNEVE